LRALGIDLPAGIFYIPLFKNTFNDLDLAGIIRLGNEAVFNVRLLFVEGSYHHLRNVLKINGWTRFAKGSGNKEKKSQK
jgi:hypothetical protein